MTCAKTVVKCEIVCLNGKSYFGYNDCANEQKVCPRGPGEGYEKCKSICQQQGHAEEMAILNALGYGADLRGATAIISGIGHYCKDCQLKLFAAGVENLKVKR